MPARHTYMLYIYRSRAVNGWQWAARVDDLPERDSRRFTDPEALLAYLGTVVRAGEPSVAPPHPAAGRAGPATIAEDGGTNDGG